MTAAKVLDVIARLPGCSGQAIDAVSAYTQVKMEGAPTQLKLLKFECPGIWIRLRRYTWPRRLARIMTNQWFLQRGICTDITLQDCNGRDSSKKVLLENGCES